MSEERSLTVGQYLRQERERKNISLPDVVKVIRITLENLEALERDDFESISAHVFVRGFLRTYASHLGLDPKEVISRYDSQIDLLKVSPKFKESTPLKSENPLFKYLIFLSLIVLAVAIGFYFFQKAPVPPPQPTPLATIPPPPTPTVQPPAPPTSPSPPEKASPKAALPPEKEKKQTEKPSAVAPMAKEEEKSKERRHVLKIVAMEKTWLRIKPDDQPVIDVLLQPKETVSWSARRRFDITIGNAGGIELFFNGVSQGRLGKPGEVVNLTLPQETKPSTPPVSKPPKPSVPAPPKETKPSVELAPKETKPAMDVASEGSKSSVDVAPKESKPAEDASANAPKPVEEEKTR